MDYDWDAQIPLSLSLKRDPKSGEFRCRLAQEVKKGEEQVTEESKGISKEGRRKDEEVFRL